ncbi:MAG: hypothetical protein ACYTGZ_10360 [Planctomycetota bacterium]|jgi:hypothetical protein
MQRHVASLLLLAAVVGADSDKLARPPKDGLFAYSGPLWEAWRFADRKRAGKLLVRLHTGKLARDVALPKGHEFLLVLGNGTVVTAPKDRKYVSLLDADGKRTDRAPYVWKRPTRVVAAYRDGIVVQPEEKGTGHLCFVPWSKGVLDQKRRVRLTKEDKLVLPIPRVYRHGQTLRWSGYSFDLATKQRTATDDALPSGAFLWDGKTFVDARTGFLLRQGVLYSLRATKDAVQIISRPIHGSNLSVVGDFRIPESSVGDVTRGQNALSFRPDLRGARHARWDSKGIVYWNGKEWTRVNWPKAKEA